MVVVTYRQATPDVFILEVKVLQQQTNGVQRSSEEWLVGL